MDCRKFEFLPSDLSLLFARPQHALAQQVIIPATQKKVARIAQTNPVSAMFWGIG